MNSSPYFLVLCTPRSLHLTCIHFISFLTQAHWTVFFMFFHVFFTQWQICPELLEAEKEGHEGKEGKDGQEEGNEGQWKIWSPWRPWKPCNQWHFLQFQQWRFLWLACERLSHESDEGHEDWWRPMKATSLSTRHFVKAMKADEGYEASFNIFQVISIYSPKMPKDSQSGI